MMNRRVGRYRLVNDLAVSPGSVLLPVAALVAATIVLAAPSPARADLFVWDGGGTSNDVAQASNYDPNGAPPDNGTANIEFRDSPRPFPTVFSEWYFEGLIFSANSSTYDMLGARLLLGVGGISNTSSRTHIIENDVLLMTTQYWVAFAPLIQNGDVEGGSLYLAGDSNFIFNGAVSGGLTMQGEGSVRLSGNNDLDWMHIHTGELEIDTNQLGTGISRVTMEGGTTLSCAGVHTVDAPFLLSNGQLTYNGTGALTVGPLEADFGQEYSVVVDAFGEFGAQGGSDDGIVEIWNGTFVSDANIPVLGAAVVGDGVGAPGSAVLRTHTFNDLPIATMEILEDGCLDLHGSRERIGTLKITGGCITGDGARVYNEDLEVLASSQTVVFAADWDPSEPGSFATVVVANGSEEIDLHVSGAIVNSQEETLRKQGPGTMRLSGAAFGRVHLMIDEGSVLLDAVEPSTGVFDPVLAEGTVLTTGESDQLYAGTFLTTSGPATWNLEASENIRRVTSDGIVIQGAGDLEIKETWAMLFDHSSENSISVPVFLSSATPKFECNGLAVFTRELTTNEELLITGVGRVAATSMMAPALRFFGNELSLQHIDGDLEQLSGTLSPDGSQSATESTPAQLTINGDWDLQDGELLIDVFDGDPAALGFDRVNVSTTATLAGGLRIELADDGLGFTAGDRFEIVHAGTIVGAFTEVTLPDLDGDLAFEIEIDEENASVYLEVVGGASDVPESPEEADALLGPISLQAFPNPLRVPSGSFNIAYSVERQGRVQIELFDVSGRRAEVLLDQIQAVGVHRLERSDRLDRLASGGYVLVVRSPGKVERVPITLLR